MKIKNFISTHIINYENSFVKQKYMEINKNYYRPSNNRNENMIKEKLEKFWGKIYE